MHSDCGLIVHFHHFPPSPRFFYLHNFLRHISAYAHYRKSVDATTHFWYTLIFVCTKTQSDLFTKTAHFFAILKHAAKPMYTVRTLVKLTELFLLHFLLGILAVGGGWILKKKCDWFIATDTTQGVWAFHKVDYLRNRTNLILLEFLFVPKPNQLYL